MVQTGTEKRKAVADEYWRAHSRHLETPGWYQVEAPNPSARPSFRPDWRSRKGSLPEWGGDCLSGSRRHDQSPVPALPGCAKSFFWRPIPSRTQRSAQRCAPTAETGTTTRQWFSLGTQALSARHQPDQMRPAATGLGLCHQEFDSLQQIGVRRSAQSYRVFRTSH